jgi:hypothetical protein
VAVLSDLTSRVRLELGDQPKQFSLTFTGDGTTKDFPLGIHPIDLYTLSVVVHNVPVANPTGYTLEEDQGVVHFVTAPASGYSIVITGISFRYFTDSDIYVNL